MKKSWVSPWSISAAARPTWRSSSAAASGTAVIAVGGDHFTNDIAVGLRTPIPDAEKIKRRSGCALSSMVDEDETIEVASVGGRSRVMARRILSDILQPRAEEMFHLAWDEINKAGYEKSLNSGIVLTGGGAILTTGFRGSPSRFSTFRSGGAGRLAWEARRSSPIRRTTTAVGLVIYADRHRTPEGARSGGALTRMVGRLRTVFKEFF